MNNTPLIQLENVSFRYDDKSDYILKNVSLSLTPGDKISIIGVNGAGKTTLLKILAGLQKVKEGSITRAKDTKVEYISQNFTFDQTYPITVIEFLRLFYPKLTTKKLLTFFDTFELKSSVINMKLCDLSGGQKQKILLIRALISGPDVLLLDEPTSGIDILAEEKFYENISFLHKKFPHIASVIISHHLHFVYKYSNKVIFLHKNKVCMEKVNDDSGISLSEENIFGEYILPYNHNHNHKNECEI